LQSSTGCVCVAAFVQAHITNHAFERWGIGACDHFANTLAVKSNIQFVHENAVGIVECLLGGCFYTEEPASPIHCRQRFAPSEIRLLQIDKRTQSCPNAFRKRGYKIRSPGYTVSPTLVSVISLDADKCLIKMRRDPPFGDRKWIYGNINLITSIWEIFM